MPLDDIEQDEAPRDDKTRRSVNTTNRTNTKRDNVDDDTAEELGNTRQDTDGGHKRDTTSGGAVVSSGNKDVKKDSPREEQTNDDNAISGFIQKLLNGTFGNTSGDDEEDKGANTGTGGGQTGGETGGRTDTPPDKPKDDEFIDKDEGTGEKNTGGDRSGEFGSGTTNPPAEEKPVEEKPVEEKPGEVKPPTFHFERADASRRSVNKSKGTYIEYKGVQYPIDRKGTEYSDTETDVAKQEAAWSDDTITVGETEITLLEYFAKTDSERIELFNNALGLVEPEQTDTPKDENPATNPQDPEQKFEPKEKSNASPEVAPAQVENSKALTESKLRELNLKTEGVPVSMRIESFIKPVFGPGDAHIPGGIYAGATSKGYWAFRSNVNKTIGQGIVANEFKIKESSITGAVKYGAARGTWAGLTKSPILGVKIDSGKNLKITNYPIIMNFPEVGIPNKAIPYVAENQTEQHMMVTGGFHNKGGWGIGTMETFSSWGERSHWCGYSTAFCFNHSGYTTKYDLTNPAGAHNASIVYAEQTPKPLTPESEGTYASLPMFVNPDTGKMEVDPDLQNLGCPVKGGDDARTHCHFYKFYKQTKYTKKETKIETTTKIVNGKPQVVNKEIVTKKDIEIKVYEQMLANPISVYFIRGVHFTKGGMTDMGKKLMEHFLSQRGWETSIITRGSHVEVCPYLNPDGSMWRIGGNTTSNAISGNAAVGKVSGAGWRFCSQPGKIWDFADDGVGDHIAFHKLINSKSSPDSQKIEPTMNGIFRRTELVDNYMKAVVNRQKGILGTLKNTLYDQIIEPG